MQNKYIELLLKRCVRLDKSKCLFISYDIINQNFIDKLVSKAKEIGFEEFCLYQTSIYKEHDILKDIALNEIEKHPYFDNSIYNGYTKKGANFLMFRCPTPGVMDDVESEKLARAEYIKRKTRSFFIELQLNHKIPWTIAALPNEIWAKKVFDNKSNSKELLEDILYKICMCDTENPINSWNEHLDNNKYMISKLNDLKLKVLHYKNKLGTDLKLELLPDTIWCDASSNGISNMPSYEIFTTPDYRKTEGIVYSSRPLIYNGGVIDQFWMKFKDGKVIEYDAKRGKDILKGIINSDSNSCYLGECALVENDSPISNTGLVYGLTLLDENASCHLALGEGFVECSKNNDNLSKEELLAKGINLSSAHVDFMIGTSDLEIIGETVDGKKIKILEKGNFKK